MDEAHQRGSDSPPPPIPVDEQAQRIRELERTLKAQDEFVAITVHELRNPMTPIIGLVDLLLEKVKRPESGCSEQIVDHMALLHRLIEEYIARSTALMDLSRISTGMLRLSLAEMDLSRLLREQIDRWKPALEKSFGKFETTIEAGIVVRCDRLAVEQILDNLLSNAIKFAANQPLEISLASDGRAARLTVRDHGIGIPEHDQSRIFEAFKRTDRQSDQSGFGVGLWVVSQLANAMGGDASVVSAPASGSAFTVTLPLVVKAD